MATPAAMLPTVIAKAETDVAIAIRFNTRIFSPLVLFWLVP
ncbi:hypothetical protein BRUCa_0950 [Brucella melitensis]|nr:hypothetical protein BM28_A0966 [Brucella melitensis M28]